MSYPGAPETYSFTCVFLRLPSIITATIRIEKVLRKRIYKICSRFEGANYNNLFKANEDLINGVVYYAYKWDNALT